MLETNLYRSGLLHNDESQHASAQNMDSVCSVNSLPYMRRQILQYFTSSSLEQILYILRFIATTSSEKVDNRNQTKNNAFPGIPLI